MKKLNRNNRIAETVEHANRKLRGLVADSGIVRFEDVEITFDDAGEDSSVMSGGRTIAEGNDLQVVKAAVWAIVDEIRRRAEKACADKVDKGYAVYEGGHAVYRANPSKPVQTSKPVQSVQTENTVQSEKKEASPIDSVMEKVADVIGKANQRLREIVGDESAFSLAEVEMAARFDAAAVYVTSGSTPVAAVLRRGDPADAFREIKSAVWKTVDETREAVYRRGELDRQSAELSAESGKQAAAADALRAAGLDPAEILGCVDSGARDAVVKAANEAVEAANLESRVEFHRAVEAVYGGHMSAKFRLTVFEGGIVVKCGGKACLVTRFPKGAPKDVERMVGFIRAEIAGMAQSRRAYLESVEKAASRFEAFGKAARLMAEADAIIAQA